MARDVSPRAPAPRERHTVTAVARLYHGACTALAQTLGLSVQEVLMQHRESVTAIFIECCRRDIRLPASVQLPPLAHGHSRAPDTPAVDTPVDTPADTPPAEPPTPTNGQDASTAPWPLMIPTDAGLPCGGQGIRTLRPGQLRMLLARVEQLAQTKGGQWPTLLQALQREQGRRRRS